MKKLTQVVLTKDVKAVGGAGDLASVRYGHYRNYLFPQGLAEEATPEVIAKIEKAAAKKAAELEKVEALARATATSLKTVKGVTIKKKVNDDGGLFDSVTAKDVIEAVQAITAVELPEAGLTLPEMKELGTYQATVVLHPNVTAEFSVAVETA